MAGKPRERDETRKKDDAVAQQCENAREHPTKRWPYHVPISGRARGIPAETSSPFSSLLTLFRRPLHVRPSLFSPIHPSASPLAAPFTPRRVLRVPDVKRGCQGEAPGIRRVPHEKFHGDGTPGIPRRDLNNP